MSTRRALATAWLLAAAVGLALPAEAGLKKIAWTPGDGVTRVRFSSGASLWPDVARPHPAQLRVDLREAADGDLPGVLRVQTPQVRSVQRLPAAARGLLPDGVEERFLVQLADPTVGWSFQPVPDGFVLLIGDPALVGESPAAAPAPYRQGPASPFTPSARRETERPRADEALRPPVPFRVGADLPVRVAPSSLSLEMERAGEGDVRVADARRGPWLHLGSGGWIRHALSAAAPRRTSRPRRSPVAFSVVTIVPVLDIRVEEVHPGTEPEADAVADLFAVPVQVARLTVLATGSSPYGFRFPPKKDRIVMKLQDGRTVGSLDPADVRRRPHVSDDQLRGAFPVPQIGSGEGFSGWLVLPGDVDLLDVDEAFVDVNGRLQRLFRVPGSGEPPGR